MTKDVAIEAIKNENLGKRSATDFLCLSFSSTDLIGHSFGPNSLEVADCYVRLDRDIEDLLKFLDNYLGKNNVLVFLTADHGAAINPQFAGDEQLNGGIIKADSLLSALNTHLSADFGKGDWISAMMDQQVYLNKKFISEKNIKEEEIAAKVRDFLSMQEGILCVLSPKYNINTCAPYVQTTIMNGYQPQRSGDILYSLAPGWIDWYIKKGTTHGSVYSYDNHVPLLWYGWKVEPGNTAEPVVIPDIAATLSNWLQIAFPSGCTGKPITAIHLKK
jgi:arylsulfatase A-like enzyme